MDMNLSKLWKIVEDRGGWCAAVHGVADLDMTEWLNNNITINTHTQTFLKVRKLQWEMPLCRRRRDQGGFTRCSSCFIALKHRPWKEIDATGVPVGDCTFAQIICCCPGWMETCGHVH